MPFFPLGDFMDKQITFRMGQANVRRRTGEILRHLDGGDSLDTKDLVTHVLPLEKAAQAYELFQKKQDGVIKIVLRPRPTA
jgi:threonine dehydrogenase-like Zn-dependent dehydrogenase